MPKSASRAEHGIRILKRRWIGTKEERALARALASLGVRVRTGVPDGYKTIDISMPDARIDIEVDGMHHFTDSRQIIADLDRGHYSHRDGYDTMHIPNEMVRHHCAAIARALAIVAQERPNRLHIRVLKAQSPHQRRSASSVR